MLTACPLTSESTALTEVYVKVWGIASSQQQSPQHHRHSREGTDTAPEDLDSPFYLLIFI